MDFTLEQLIPIDSFIEKYPHIWANKGQFKWFWFNRDKNGITKHGVICKMGNKFYVDSVACAIWLKEGNE